MDFRQSRPLAYAPSSQREGRAARGGRRVAVLLCLIPAVYLLATAGYALLHADHYAADLARQLRYVIVPGAIALGLILAALRLPRGAALNLGIVALSILATLFLFESWLTLRLLPRQGDIVGVVGEGVDLDPYRRNLPPAYTIKGLNATLEVTALDRAALSAIPDQPLMLCSTGGQPVTYRTDAYGLRNPPDLAPGPADVLVLGDSFVEGLCLPDGQGVTEQLRARVAGPLVNTGSRGAGPLYELAVLGRYGPVFTPRVTLMAFFEGNDWENLENEVKEGWLAQALDPAADFGSPDWSPADLRAADAVIDGWWNTGAASLGEMLRRRSVLRNYFALANTAQVLGLHYAKSMTPSPVFPVLLHRATQIAQGWGGRMVMVYIPAHDRYAGLIRSGFVMDGLRRMVLDAAAEAGMPVIDLTDSFDRHPDPRSLYAPDSHFSAKGAALAADEIAAGLARLDPA